MKSSSPSFQPPSPEVEARVQGMLDGLSLDEKIELLSGHPDQGSTSSCDAIGFPALKMADGPVGVHWWCEASTAYPALIAAAATWDRGLLERLGWALGRDCRARGIHILLAPGVNIYRSPLCGRNFEYMGEDPVLAARLVVPYIRGVQDQGVATTVKHYAANFQEYNRHHVSSDIDERTLRELYLPAFRAAVEEAGSGALMTAYNPVNGEHCSQHDDLINRILKGEWGFDGVVMSDWVSCYDTVGIANGGLDLEMPKAEYFTPERLQAALDNGLVPMEALDDKVRRLLRLAVCFGWLEGEQKDETIPHEDPDTAQVALDIARAGTVLLKNERDLLPLDRRLLRTVAVIGSHARPAVICGGGSAYTPPHRSVSILDGIRDLAGGEVDVTHHSGEDRDAAVAAARAADAVILCVGFTPETEGENHDRRFGLDPETEALIRDVGAANDAVVTVLTAGGGVDFLPWLDSTRALLHAWYPGQEGGRAIAEILFGAVNPRGKLPVTLDRRLEDRSSFACYHDEDEDLRVRLSDGVFSGYRHNDRHGIEPLYPFGFGLSYTTFAYDHLSLRASRIGPGEPPAVCFEVQNTGSRSGSEVAQVYVGGPEASLPRPVKELKGFACVNELEPGERRRVTVELPADAFRYFHPARGGWIAEPGEFRIEVGASSADIRLRGTVAVRGD